jgi:hypothetical protein
LRARDLNPRSFQNQPFSRRVLLGANDKTLIRKNLDLVPESDLHAVARQRRLEFFVLVRDEAEQVWERGSGV